MENSYSEALITMHKAVENDLKKISGNRYLELKNYQLPESNEKHISVDLTNWSFKEKENLFLDILNGIKFYYQQYAKTKSFPVGGYNSVVSAINGNDKIQIYINSIKWFSEQSIHKLIKDGNIESLVSIIKKG
jgi:hypothetical protein